MGSLYHSAIIQQKRLFPDPTHITWSTMYQLEGPIYTEMITVHIMDGQGKPSLREKDTKLYIYDKFLRYVWGLRLTESAALFCALSVLNLGLG